MIEFTAQFKTSKTLRARQRAMKKRMQALQKRNPEHWAIVEEVDAYYLRSLKKYLRIMKVEDTNGLFSVFAQ